MGWSWTQQRPSMTNITSMKVAQRPLTSSIVAAHLSNPILQAAVLNHRVHIHSPTTLPPAQAEQAGLYPGYYIRCCDGNNYWIGRDQKEGRFNLGKIAERVLKSEFDFEYDIEYSFGHVVGGGSPWENMSAIDAFV